MLHVRNYDRGLTHRITILLPSGEAKVTDLGSLVQPSAEEIAEARALILEDSRLRALAEDSSLHLSGGFFVRSRMIGDPCLGNICLEFHFVRTGSAAGSVRRVIVDLGRGRIAHPDFPGLLDRRLPVSLTAEEVEP